MANLMSNNKHVAACSYFVDGKCKYGSKCKYSHNIDTFSASLQKKITCINKIKSI